MQVIALKGPVQFLVGSIFHKAHKREFPISANLPSLPIYSVFTEYPE